MKFCDVQDALMAGKKVKLSNWKNAYWYYDQEREEIMNHFEDAESNQDVPTAALFPRDLLWIMKDNWEVVDDDQQKVPADTYSFGDAMNFLKGGKKVARKGWNGKNMFLFLATDIEFHTEADLACVSNLEGDLTLPAIVMKTADDRFCVGWLASQTDMLSDDWYTVE